MTGESAAGAGPVHHWFEPLADHLGSAYLRYSFTRGTTNEVDFLWQVLELRPGMRVLDVGCGPGRHANALAERGVEVVGVDIAAAFLAVAARQGPAGARYIRADARDLPVRDAFDAAISLCQGAFGLGGPRAQDAHGDLPSGPDPDEQILGQIASSVRPGGRVVVSAFSAYFQVRWLEATDTFDASTGVNHERTELRDAAGTVREADLWTTCFTPRELRLVAERAGLDVRHCWSVSPGDYRARPPDLDHPELLLVASRPT